MIPRLLVTVTVARSGEGQGSISFTICYACGLGIMKGDLLISDDVVVVDADHHRVVISYKDKFTSGSVQVLVLSEQCWEPGVGATTEKVSAVEKFSEAAAMGHAIV